MIVRTRLRSIALPIVFYLVLGVTSGYLVSGASNGEHGLIARLKFDAEAEELTGQLSVLKEMNVRAGKGASPASCPKAWTGISWMRRPTPYWIASERTRSSSSPRPVGRADAVLGLRNAP